MKWFEIIGITVFVLASFALPWFGHWFQCWADEQNEREWRAKIQDEVDRLNRPWG